MIIWRYLLTQYIKVLSLSAIAFIAILLTSRLDDIAHFASLGANSIYVLYFTLYQIPYILPIVIPISALISALLLIQRLSSSHELTALRASGLSLKAILAPILIFAAYLSALNFYIVSEVATESHLVANTLKSQLRQINPLLVLHNKHMMRLKGIFFDSFGESKIGESASDAIIAIPGKEGKQMNLIIAKNLQASDSSFLASFLTYITPLQKGGSDQFDPFFIENMEKSTTPIQDFSKTLHKKIFSINNDQLTLSFLLARIESEKNSLQQAKELFKKEEIKTLQRNVNRGYTEIIRRISIALAVFTFTLMGLSFGASISRTRSNKGVVFLIGLAALYLACFFVAKSIEYQLMASFILYIAPHCIILFFSWFNLTKLSRGIE
ncbi:MAG TPA: LptF/LptG family permease [Parachlamydiaceae bacterium]|nr:LptF/LptG family permease [Parachlamydiaceae bacterium]